MTRQRHRDGSYDREGSDISCSQSFCCHRKGRQKRSRSENPFECRAPSRHSRSCRLTSVLKQTSEAELRTALEPYVIRGSQRVRCRCGKHDGLQDDPPRAEARRKDVKPTSKREKSSRAECDSGGSTPDTLPLYCHQTFAREQAPLVLHLGSSPTAAVPHVAIVPGEQFTSTLPGGSIVQSCPIGASAHHPRMWEEAPTGHVYPQGRSELMGCMQCTGTTLVSGQPQRSSGKPQERYRGSSGLMVLQPKKYQSSTGGRRRCYEMLASALTQHQKISPYNGMGHGEQYGMILPAMNQPPKNITHSVSGHGECVGMKASAITQRLKDSPQGSPVHGKYVRMKVPTMNRQLKNLPQTSAGCEDNVGENTFVMSPQQKGLAFTSTGCRECCETINPAMDQQSNKTPYGAVGQGEFMGRIAPMLTQNHKDSTCSEAGHGERCKPIAPTVKQMPKNPKYLGYEGVRKNITQKLQSPGRENHTDHDVYMKEIVPQAIQQKGTQRAENSEYTNTSVASATDQQPKQYLRGHVESFQQPNPMIVQQVHYVAAEGNGLADNINPVFPMTIEQRKCHLGEIHSPVKKPTWCALSSGKPQGMYQYAATECMIGEDKNTASDIQQSYCQWNSPQYEIECTDEQRINGDPGQISDGSDTFAYPYPITYPQYPVWYTYCQCSTCGSRPPLEQQAQMYDNNDVHIKYQNSLACKNQTSDQVDRNKTGVEHSLKSRCVLSNNMRQPYKNIDETSIASTDAVSGKFQSMIIGGRSLCRQTKDSTTQTYLTSLQKLRMGGKVPKTAFASKADLYSKTDSVINAEIEDKNEFGAQTLKNTEQNISLGESLKCQTTLENAPVRNNCEETTRPIPSETRESAVQTPLKKLSPSSYNNEEIKTTASKGTICNRTERIVQTVRPENKEIATQSENTYLQMLSTTRSLDAISSVRRPVSKCGSVPPPPSPSNSVTDVTITTSFTKPSDHTFPILSDPDETFRLPYVAWPCALKTSASIPALKISNCFTQQKHRSLGYEREKIEQTGGIVSVTISQGKWTGEDAAEDTKMSVKNTDEKQTPNRRQNDKKKISERLDISENTTQMKALQPNNLPIELDGQSQNSKAKTYTQSQQTDRRPAEGWNTGKEVTVKNESSPQFKLGAWKSASCEQQGKKTMQQARQIKRYVSQSGLNSRPVPTVRC